MGGFSRVWSGLIGLLRGGGAGFEWLENRVVGPQSTDGAADVPGVGSLISNVPEGSPWPMNISKGYISKINLIQVWLIKNFYYITLHNMMTPDNS